MKKYILLFLFLIPFWRPVMAQLPVGTRVQPMFVNTNTGVVSYGSNGVLTITFTNAMAMSNAVTIFPNGALTNNGSMVVSNEVHQGAISFKTKIASLSSITNNDYGVTNNYFILITNQSAANIVFTGFSGGFMEGQQIHVVNYTLTNMTFIADSTSSASSNRIDLLGYSSTNTLGKGSASFIYNTFSNTWTLQNFTQ